MHSTRVVPLLALAALLDCTRTAELPPQRSSTASLHDVNHPPPRDTLGAQTYEGWKQYSLFCARCHGDDAVGTSFGPDLVAALRPDGSVPSRAAFTVILAAGRPDRGMPAASRLGLDPAHFDEIFGYLLGRSAGRLHGGRPALRNP